jgi:hypothetical protein
VIVAQLELMDSLHGDLELADLRDSAPAYEEDTF